MTSLISAISTGVKAANIVQKAANNVMDRTAENYGVLWEQNESVEACRNCDNKFQPPLNMKHHCRACGGVFCDNCCQNVELTPFITASLPESVNVTEIDSVKVCIGCRRGECVGKHIKELVKQQLEVEQGTKKENIVDKIQQKVVSKIKEAAGEYDFPPPKVLHLSYGSYYGEDGKARKSGTRPLPVSGYFEIHNKSSEVFCVKVLYNVGNTRFEIPRPSYKAVPPGESMYSSFSPDQDILELFILHANPDKIEADRAINYDTSAPGANPTNLSRSAQVGQFRRVITYNIGAQNKNVLLKYKGRGIVVPREGDSIVRVGLVGKLQNKKYAANKIDYSTNTNSIRLNFEIVT